MEKVIDKKGKVLSGLMFGLTVVFGASAFAAVSFKAGEGEVVVAADAPKTVLFAAEEATNFLSQVLAAPVPIVRTPTAGKASLVLGDNSWSREAGIDTADFVRDEFVIREAGGRVFIVGKDDPTANPWAILNAGGWHSILFEHATNFGVYEFLERAAGVRFYFPGELGTIVPKADSVTFAGTVRVKPDFTSRFLQMWHGDYFEPDPKNRQKTLDYFRLRFETMRVPACHGSRAFRYQPRFAKTHPEYFCLLPNGQRDLSEKQMFDSVQPGQLCWSSGIVEEMYKDALSYLRGEDASVRGIPNFKRNGAFAWNENCAYGRYVDLMPQDGMIPCNCPKCKAAFAAAGGRGLTGATDLIWGAVSNVATRLTAAGADGVVSMMAYGAYKSVPDFALPPNIEVMLATMGPWSFHNARQLAADDRIVSAWAKKLGHPIRLWNYPCKLTSLLKQCRGVAQNCPRTWANFYKHSAKWINGAFAESESDRWFFNYLNYYVFAKVCWDNDVDVDALLKEHYRLMFGPAAADMAEIYETLEECWAKGVVGKVIETPMGPIVSRPSDAEIWERIYSPERIARFDALVASARAKVAPDSLEAKRIDLVNREFVSGLHVRSAEYAKFAAGLKALELALGVGEEKTVSLVPFNMGSAGLKKTAQTKTVRTDVTVRRAADALVIRFDCEEPRMKDVVAQTHDKEYPNLWQENVVEVFLDPVGDGTSYCQLLVNSEGSWTDWHQSLIYMPTDGIRWNSGMDVKVEKRVDSWSATLSIPIAAFPKLPKKFAINFARERNLKGGGDYEPLYQWSPYAFGFNDLPNLGRVIFK